MKILIAIPCMDQVATPFMQSLLSLRHVGDVQYICAAGSLVYESRNRLAQYAINDGFDYVLFLDSDMTFEPDILIRLVESIEGRDFVTGLCFSRHAPRYRPCIYKRLGYEIDQNEMRLIDETYYEYPEGEIFEVEGSGMACALIRTKVLETVLKQKGLPFSPIIGFGEDLSFCIKARQCGFRLYCNSDIRIGHVGTVIIDEEVFKGKYYGNSKQYQNSTEDQP